VNRSVLELRCGDIELHEFGAGQGSRVGDLAFDRNGILGGSINCERRVIEGGVAEAMSKSCASKNEAH
jgi:hypothetical protein